MTSTERMKVTDVTVLAALAHPIRLSILHLLLTVGEQTATQCSEVVDATPSACSYHLRHLERFGLVERVDQHGRAGADGRTKVWRAVATGFDFGEPAGSPEFVAASSALISVGLDENLRLARHYLSHLDLLPDEWRRAASFSTFALLVNADELRSALDKIDAIIRPLRVAVRVDAPDDARSVRLSIEAFPRTDLP